MSRNWISRSRPRQNNFAISPGRLIAEGSRLIAGIILFLYSTSSLLAAPVALPELPPAPTRFQSDSSSVQGSENLRVQKFEVEVGRTLDLPAVQPLFHIIQAPKIAVLVEKTPTSLRIRGQAIGETLVLISEGGQMQSYLIRVVRPRKEVEKIKMLQNRSSRLYESQQARTFKVFYDTTFSTLYEDRVLGRVTESRKLNRQNMGVTGGTPFGDLKGNLFYEYRKEHSLGKSVGMPKDVQGGLYNTDLPGLRHYDLIGGTHYVAMDNFGMPGQRISGFMLEPNIVRMDNARRGQVDTTFFIGEKRDGSIIDNPAGIQNRELLGRVSGQKLGYHLWKNGYVSGGHYNQWYGPRTELESKNNFTSQFDFILPFLRILGDGGIDDRRHVAGEIRSFSDNSWASLTSRWFGVDDHYRSLTGSVIDRGNRGAEFGTRFLPFQPFFNKQFLLLTGDMAIVRNRLSVNPDRQDGYLKSFRSGVTLNLPYELVSETRLHQENRMAASFPYIQQRIDQKLTKDIRLNSVLVRRVRIYLTSSIEGFTDAVNTPGFNSNRYEAGGGGTVHLRGGLWLGAKYLWNYLNEKDPATSPNPVTHPRQVTLYGGWTHRFSRLPVDLYTTAFYGNETQTHNKIHQPFFNENRLEIRGGLGWRVRPNVKFFVESATTVTQSIVGQPDHAEFLIETGMRVTQDTHFYIPLKGKVEGSVFEDRNGNSRRDPDETGIAGYEVKVQSGPKTKTDSKGYYRLKVKEGLVTVIGMDRIPEGYYFTTVNRQELEVAPKSTHHLDFGIAPQIQVKGMAFLDVNENGIQENDDIPMSGIQFLMDSGQAAVTGGNGLYSVLHVLPGKNKIRVMAGSIPAGYKTLTPLEKVFDGAPGDILNFNAAFSIQRTGGGVIFHDENKNGQLDPGEKGLAGISLRINDRILKTDRQGRYMAALKPGNNKISIVESTLPEGAKAETLEQDIETGSGVFSRTDIYFPILLSPAKESS